MSYIPSAEQIAFLEDLADGHGFVLCLGWTLSHGMAIRKWVDQNGAHGTVVSIRNEWMVYQEGRGLIQCGAWEPENTDCEQEEQEANPAVIVRYDDHEAMLADELYGKGVTVHLEMMDKHTLWGRVEATDGTNYELHIHSPKKPLVFRVERWREDGQAENTACKPVCVAQPADGALCEACLSVKQRNIALEWEIVELRKRLGEE